MTKLTIALLLLCAFSVEAHAQRGVTTCAEAPGFLAFQRQHTSHILPDAADKPVKPMSSWPLFPHLIPGTDGFACIALAVDKTGHVHDIRVLYPRGTRLLGAEKESLMKVLFEPLQQAGQPREFLYFLPVTKTKL